MQASFLSFVTQNRKNISLFFLAFTLLCFVLFTGLSKLNLEEDISATLPQGAEFKELNSFLTQNKLNNQIAFVLDVENLTENEVDNLADSLTNFLNTNYTDYLESFTYYSDIGVKEFYSFFYNQIPEYFSEELQDSLQKRTSERAIDGILKDAYKKIQSPQGNITVPYILKDPFSLTPIILNQIQLGQDDNYQQKNGITYSANGKSIFFFSTLKDSIQKNNAAQIVFAEKLKDFKSIWNAKFPKNQFDYFSPFLIAVANATQVKIDTNLTLGIFIVFTLLLLFIYYRKWSTPIYFLLPAFFGLLFSLGTIGWFKGNISAISIAAGAIVLGIILDYAFHFFTHYKHSKSLEETVNDIALPLFTGSFTTVLAFLALQFTNSTILKDFGLFAALSLLGAAFFTVVVLPIVLKITNFSFGKSSEKQLFKKSIKLPFKISSKVYFLIIAVFTVFFFYQSKNISFDSNIDNLGFHPKEFKDSEERIFKLNPENEKKVFLFAKSKNLEEAKKNNLILFKKLQKTPNVKQVSSSAQFFYPEKIKEKNSKRWKLFWSENKVEVFKNIDKYALKYGFEISAFNEFKNLVNNQILASKNEEAFLKELGIDKLANTSSEEITFITTLVVSKENKAEVLKSIEKIEGIDILDRSAMASSLLEIIRKDFNFILLITSLIVFLTLLLVYGRIELALVVFIPMLVSWIWIVGLAALLGIQFNFVNIIITTFIFGLGDDFSIFISDGILNKYKYGKNLLSTYKTAIILSAITTIVGTGVLILAKHPAVYSIGFISVLGMICILFISLTLQPILYKWLIFNRLEKNRSPWTLTSYLVSAFAYFYFFIGCMLGSVIAFLFALIPMSKKKKRQGMATILHYGGASLIYIMFNVTKKFFNRDVLNLEKPSILIANHSSVLDILLTLTISPKVLLVTNNWVYNSPFFGYLVRTAGFVLNSDLENNLDSIQEKINDGYSIMIFPEGTRSKTGEIARFKKGAFFLAEKLNLDITPVLIHGAHYTMSKSDFQLKNSWLNVKFLERISPEQFQAENYSKRTKLVAKHFKNEHRKFSYEMENTAFLKEPIFYNYVYKGPILEWYFRIKYKLEEKKYNAYEASLNHHFAFDEALDILNLGCGYGFLDYFLFLKNKKRNILGVDYDEEKIMLANNNYIKNKNINFKQGDLRNYSFEKQYDVIFVMDVLHYFSAENQEKILIQSIENLNQNGILFIRDGVSNLAEKHKKTKLTEFFSSKFGFNKKDEAFHFFDQAFIENLAKKYHLKLEMTSHSENTSNMLFKLVKSNEN